MRCLILIVSLLVAAPVAATAADTTLSAPTRYAEVEGTRLAYRVIGAGPTVLALNRLRGTLDTWDPAFLDALAADHRLILVDYPGVGYSNGSLPPDMARVADIIAAFATAVGAERFDVMGWSWGGALTQVFLVRHPDRVRRAVLIGANPPGRNELPMQDVWFNRAIKPVNDLADDEILFFEPKSAASVAAARRSRDRIYARPGVVDRIPATIPEFNRFFEAAQRYKDDADDIRGDLTRAAIPMLILCGDDDPVVPAANWYPLVGTLPAAQFVVLPQSGHGPQHQYPNLAARLIADFLTSDELPIRP